MSIFSPQKIFCYAIFNFHFRKNPRFCDEFQALTFSSAATLRKKLQTQAAVSHRHSRLTPNPRLPQWPDGKVSTLKAAGLGSNLAYLARSSHTSDCKIGTPKATLPGEWHNTVSVRTGWPDVSVLWLGGTALASNTQQKACALPIWWLSLNRGPHWSILEWKLQNSSWSRLVVFVYLFCLLQVTGPEEENELIQRYGTTEMRRRGRGTQTQNKTQAASMISITGKAFF